MIYEWEPWSNIKELNENIAIERRILRIGQFCSNYENFYYNTIETFKENCNCF